MDALTDTHRHITHTHPHTHAWRETRKRKGILTQLGEQQGDPLR